MLESQIFDFRKGGVSTETASLIYVIQGVSGTLFFQGQRLFFHNATGCYGSIPLNVSGDIDINPEDGEYRLSCQVSSIHLQICIKSRCT